MEAAMNRAIMNAYRSRLERLIQRLDAKRSELRQELQGADMAGTMHRPVEEQHTTDELAHDDDAVGTALSLLGTEEEILSECRAALERFDLGTFGRCVKCQRPIEKPRLETVPYARHCTRCMNSAS
jgi:RNA polymerase-binding transcription factor